MLSQTLCCVSRVALLARLATIWVLWGPCKSTSKICEGFPHHPILGWVYDGPVAIVRLTGFIQGVLEGLVESLVSGFLRGNKIRLIGFLVSVSQGLDP